MLHLSRKTYTVLAICLFGIICGLLALYLLVTQSPQTAPIQPATATSNKPLLVGLLDRSDVPPTDFMTYQSRPLVNGFVINVDWKDLQPNNDGAIDTSAIDSKLELAKNNNLSVRLRVFAGRDTPQWVKNEVIR